MVSLGYLYLINLGILRYFFTSIDPEYPGFCSRGSIVVSELAWIWVVPSPQIIEPIIYDEFWQGIIGTISTKSLCFISTIPVHFIDSTMKVSKYFFFFFNFPHFYFPYNFVVLQRNVPWSAVSWCYTMRGA